MDQRRCAACGDPLQLRKQAPHQTYCSKLECQRERKRLWQQIKRKSDPDYVENQNIAQRAWQKRNPGYWKKYRRNHPKYENQNRAQQRDRNQKSSEIAKMVSKNSSKLRPGLYQLVRLSEDKSEALDSWTVQLTIIRPEK